MPASEKRQHPLLSLAESELDFVLHMILASGSLKEMAHLYGVSYPTLRAKLDRLIDQLQNLVAGKPPDPLADRLADLLEKGEITASAARDLLNLHRHELKRVKEH